jgi:hypothetical protein
MRMNNQTKLEEVIPEAASAKRQRELAVIYY